MNENVFQYAAAVALNYQKNQKQPRKNIKN